ncbi:GMC family oxidoreductase [Novosphingobium resinovorum]|uniref:FAD-dependent oxidoreductase n=1 Tax=Novosphingobium TaxID=165696 RepID=UPI001B3C65E3|nr:MULTISPECIES: GMC family oxidoreductase [Novosphingobium]MBF7011724.1 GMC family oxidoreductase [Novosphingobium sp. HR1a]WJM26477.1 GMC family oxidoreductase [Novosphingobium resinovorum]
MSISKDFDAIVIGSGITGGWAAKELTQRGLKVAMIERGRMVEHGTDYATETLAPWEFDYRAQRDPAATHEGLAGYGMSNANLNGASSLYPLTEAPGFFVAPEDHPYQTPQDAPFNWTRAYVMGGRSLVWGRKCFRMSDLDFTANKLDGHGTDWPIRYADLAPWYDHVESFIGVSGSTEGIAHLPDGQFQPPMALNHVEQKFKEWMEAHYPGRKFIPSRLANMTEAKPDEGRSNCQYRNLCARGCSFGAYFSTQSSTLPAAQATGLLTVLTDSRVVSIEHDPATRRASGVRVRNTATGATTTVTGRTIFLCASSFNSTALLLQSTSEAFPTGLGNTSDVLGRYIMDHASGVQVVAHVPGYQDRNYTGFRPTNHFIPRFRNVGGDTSPAFLRGYGIQLDAARANWEAGAFGAGIGDDLKRKARQRGDWRLRFNLFAETLPDAENRLTLDPAARDKDGIAQIRVALRFGANERKLLDDAIAQSVEMAEGFGATVVSRPGEGYAIKGAIHEMGGVRMGRDPATSMLNGFNQMHAVENVFVTDGSAMASSAWQNPSLTYMAMTARAAAYAVDEIKQGKI